MPEITEYLLEKLGWIADRILEVLTGRQEKRLEQVKERIRPVLRIRALPPASPPGSPCDKY